jgi:hypothetical protein
MERNKFRCLSCFVEFYARILISYLELNIHTLNIYTRFRLAGCKGGEKELASDRGWLLLLSESGA